VYEVRNEMMNPTLSVVLPCYNESKGIPQLLKRFEEVGKGVSFELILVDNGSTDQTLETLNQLLPAYPFARSVRVEKNVGYGHGLFTGLQSAKGELLAWSHADLQTDPADIFRALAVYTPARGPSTLPSTLLVKGRRHGRSLPEWLVSRGMEIISFLLLRSRLTEINAQPKLFHRSLLQHLTHPPTDFNFDVYVLYRACRKGWRMRSLDVRFPPRKYGQSNWSATWRSKVRTVARSVAFMFKLGQGYWQ
jgi:glycosyltransferase involved in cell wall biosynthesis